MASNDNTALIGIEQDLLPPKRYNGAGVYFLYREEKVVYVGQASNVWSRLRTHMWEGLKNFDAARYIACDQSQLTTIERFYITAFTPEYNKCGIAAEARNMIEWGWQRDDMLARVDDVDLTRSQACRILGCKPIDLDELRGQGLEVKIKRKGKSRARVELFTLHSVDRFRRTSAA